MAVTAFAGSDIDLCSICKHGNTCLSIWKDEKRLQSLGFEAASYYLNS
jgi:hypothetical protein